VQANNKDDFLSLDFGLKEFATKDESERLRLYRKFVYEKGHIKAGRFSHRHTRTDIPVK
jgi:hypothetical protein